MIAGYYGGWTDSIISRLLDLVWAFPVYLLAISLSTVLLLQGLKLGPLTINPSSVWLPILIIGVIYVPYMARPIRGEILSLRRREFVTAAIGQGIPTWRVIFGELLPNVVPTVIVFLPLMVATDILTESSLSYLSIGVQAPNASWGTMITDGQSQLYTRPWVSIAPGIALVFVIVLLNVVGDGVRDAVDPRGLAAAAAAAPTLTSWTARRGGDAVISFVLRRLLSTVGILFALSILVFLIFFAIPGHRPRAATGRAQPRLRRRWTRSAKPSDWTGHCRCSTGE